MQEARFQAASCRCLAVEEVHREIVQHHPFPGAPERPGANDLIYLH